MAKNSLLKIESANDISEPGLYVMIETLIGETALEVDDLDPDLLQISGTNYFDGEHWMKPITPDSSWAIKESNLLHFFVSTGQMTLPTAKDSNPDDFLRETNQKWEGKPL